MVENVYTRGRPPQYVHYKGRSVKGLSLKSDGRYYTTHNDPRTGKRIYFGCDLVKAVRAFRAWKREVEAWRQEIFS